MAYDLKISISSSHLASSQADAVRLLRQLADEMAKCKAIRSGVLDSSCNAVGHIEFIASD